MTDNRPDFDVTALSPPLRVPRLTSPEVVLRPYAQADLGLVCAASADPLIPSITSVPRTYSDESGRAFIDRQHQRAIDGDGYSFVIAESPTRRSSPSGRSGCGCTRSRADAPRWATGSSPRPAVVGSLRTRCAPSRRSPSKTLAIPRVHLFVEPWNVASARTAAAAGFRHEATLKGWERIDGEQRDADCFALLRTEWAPG